MQPSLSVGQLSTSGVGSVNDGTDTYSTSLALEASSEGMSDGDPIAYLRVGRGLQPLRLAGYHVSSVPE